MLTSWFVQRDTEGSDLKSPKLIKGPDRLLYELLSQKIKNLIKYLFFFQGKGVNT